MNIHLPKVHAWMGGGGSVVQQTSEGYMNEIATFLRAGMTFL